MWKSAGGENVASAAYQASNESEIERGENNVAYDVALMKSGSGIISRQ
jgi:hypothetical protein